MKKPVILVQDRRTGVWYDPEQKMFELFFATWFKEIMIRLKNR